MGKKWRRVRKIYRGRLPSDYQCSPLTRINNFDIRFKHNGRAALSETSLSFSMCKCKARTNALQMHTNARLPVLCSDINPYN